MQLFLDFFARMTWPTVVIVLAALFRREAPELIVRIREMALPGGFSIKLKNDDLEISGKAMTAEQLAETVKALNHARNVGAASGRISARVEPILRAVRHTKDEILEWDSEHRSSPRERVHGVYESLYQLEIELFGPAIDGGPGLVGSGDTALPKDLRNRLEHLLKFASADVGELSVDQAQSHIDSVIEWCDEYARFLTVQEKEAAETVDLEGKTGADGDGETS